MKSSLEWLHATGAEFSAGEGHAGIAPLTHYSAEYREWGEGPPLVLVPGLAGGYELLGPLAQRLAANFRVISYQLRGENDCFALRRRFGLKDLVTDLGEFVEWHRLERPIVFGVSFGGILALEYAARCPQNLEALIVQGCGSRYERGLIQQVAGMVLSSYPLPTDNPFVNQFFNLLFGRKQRKDGLFDFVTRQCWQTDQSVMAHRLRLIEQFNVVSRLARLTMPTLVLAGTRDMLVSANSLSLLEEGLPRSRTVRLDGCGHLAFATHPERLASEVQSFLQIENQG